MSLAFHVAAGQEIASQYSSQLAWRLPDCYFGLSSQAESRRAPWIPERAGFVNVVTDWTDTADKFARFFTVALSRGHGPPINFPWRIIVARHLNLVVRER